jgi:phytoene dehydrogenase-like protein
MGAEVTVIGAGFGGLTAAAVLAHNGVQVEVLEATGHLGGRAAFDRKDGFLVDYGIHTHRYAAQGPAAAAMREIGHEIEFAHVGEPQLWRGGSFVDLPSGVPQFLKAGFLSAGEKGAIIRNMMKLVLSSTTRKADVSLTDALSGLDRPEVNSMFKLLSGIGMVAPDLSNASAGVFALFLKRALRSKETVGYPVGGTSQVIEALSKRVESQGSVSLNSRVKSLDIERGKVTGIRVKEEVLASKSVVFAVPVQRLPELAGDGIGKALRDKCDALVPTAGISIDLCLSSNVSDIDGVIVTADPVTMGQFTSNIDPTTAPEGKQLATWYYPLPVETMDDREAVEAEEQKLKGIIEGMFPGTMDRVEWERILRLKIVDGFEPRPGQTSKDRPAVSVPGVENLFLAGDTVSADYTAGDVAFATGVEAARQVLDYLR